MFRHIFEFEDKRDGWISHILCVKTIVLRGENLCQINVQVNLCQKLSLLHLLTHNMTKDCSLNYKFSTWVTKCHRFNVKTEWYFGDTCTAFSKGQLILKELFGVIISTKKPTFLRISALASKESSNQKTLLYNYVK